MKSESIENLFSVFETKLSSLNKLYKDLFSGGKAVRAHIVYDLSQCLHLTSDESRLLCEVVEYIHHSSILHDDVIDDSTTRRNRVASWMKFSRTKAILAGDYLLAQTSYKLSNYGNIHLLQLTARTVQKMVEGEWIQNDQTGRETFEDTNRVHILKTASLFEWCLQAPFLCKNLTDSSFQNLLNEIGKMMGQLFQRADDGLDFGVRNEENKSEFKDLKQGSLNFFGLFLKKNLKLKNDQALRACQNMEDLKKILGETSFEEQIKDFDKMNESLIRCSYDRIEQLRSFLKEDEQEVISVLKSWVKKIYFRKA